MKTSKGIWTTFRIWKLSYWREEIPDWEFCVFLTSNLPWKSDMKHYLSSLFFSFEVTEIKLRFLELSKLTWLLLSSCLRSGSYYLLSIYLLFICISLILFCSTFCLCAVHSLNFCLPVYAPYLVLYFISVCPHFMYPSAVCTTTSTRSQ